MLMGPAVVYALNRVPEFVRVAEALMPKRPASGAIEADSVCDVVCACAGSAITTTTSVAIPANQWRTQEGVLPTSADGHLLCTFVKSLHQDVAV
jgi:hypothetical protein